MIIIPRRAAAACWVGDPVVFISSAVITPAPADCHCSTVDPTVLAAITVSNLIADCSCDSIDPTVLYGDVIITNLAATARCIAISPSVSVVKPKVGGIHKSSKRGTLGL